MKELEIIEALDEIIDEFIERSKIFVQWSCYLPGLKDHLDKQESIRHVYDHEYLAFTKSTKTLISIKHLLELEHVQDVYILIRSMFENYLAARYLNNEVKDDSDIKLLDDFIQNKIKVALGIYSVKYKKVVDEQGQKVADNKSIISLVMGMDKLYYAQFYGYLSRFTHLDFSILGHYIDENNSFVLDKEVDVAISRLFVVFVYTKIFESIVTINGEDFYDGKEEEKCYEIVRKSLKLQRKIFDIYIKDLNFNHKNLVVEKQRLNMESMLTNMNLSLEDDIGDLDKTNLF